MRNKILSFTLVLATGACLYLFLRSRPHERNPVEPSPHPLPVASAITPKAAPKTFQAKHSPARPGEERFAEKPEGNVIPFKVVKGLAVAYGDLLLGTPEQPETTEGYYEATAPQAWDRPEIPYFINPDLPQPARVEQALEYLRRRTPVSFVPFQGQPDAIVFERGAEHCYSLLGRVGGHQSIHLSDKCQWPDILHEVMHALGFIHEQSRADRDQYVQIKWENIEEDYKDQFAIVPDSFMLAQRDSPFDYRSVMLYRPDSFARQPSLLTMVAKGAFAIEPTEQGLSEEDLHRLQRMFPR